MRASIHYGISIISLLKVAEVASFSSSSSHHTTLNNHPSHHTQPQHHGYSSSHSTITTSLLQSMVSDEEAQLLLDDFYDDADDLAEFEDFTTTQQQQSQKQTQNNTPIRRFKRPKKVPLIAVVGRPNVGKSALVNRLAGQQSGGAIVADEEGITRDRTYRNAEFPRRGIPTG